MNNSIMLLSLTLLFCGLVQADPVTLNVTGSVSAAACTVNPILSGGQHVDLGTLGRTKFQTAGQAGEWKNFTLNLTDCPPGTTYSTATFSGTPDGNDATLFANTEPAASAATHIAVQMARGDDHSSMLANNSSLTIAVDAPSHTVTFPLAARLYTPVGGVRAGEVSSVVLVNFTYQ